MSDDSLQDELRRAGLVQCHRVWLRPEQFEQVKQMAAENLPTVIRIKRNAKLVREMREYGKDMGYD